MLRAFAPVCFASQILRLVSSDNRRRVIFYAGRGATRFEPLFGAPQGEGDLYLEVYRTSGAEPETRVTLVRCRR
jgi:hypothetical protein